MSRSWGAANPGRLFFLFWLLFVPLTHATETTHESNPETGIESWALHDQGAALLLTQITPDQATAFFLGRGFDRAAADHFATACIFMMVVRNESAAAPISYRLADWRYVTSDGKEHNLKLTREWLNEWRRRKLPEPSLIAFEWSQHPAEQTFEVGDWNQGMVSFELPRGSRFDLKFRWSVKAEMKDSMLKDVRCAPGS
jgi:hypothetical protein